MKICKKCNLSFTTKVNIDGKERNLQNRKFCLKCSPFGEHNTRNINEICTGNCVVCGKLIPKKRKNGKRCYCCVQKDREIKILHKVHNIVGTKCWICNYDKGIDGTPMLDFHHMRDKKFGLDKRKLTNHSWDRVWIELQKCMLLCCRCHREVERGFVDKDIVNNIYETNWNIIKWKN